MKFHEDSKTVEFIKGELGRTPIPNCRPWHEGEGAIKNRLYIFGNGLYRATETVTYSNNGYLNSKNDSFSSFTDFFQWIDSYFWGDYMHGITVKYQSNSKQWNRLDHWMLGMYLRWQKELFGVDLMYGYNCWDGETLNQLIDDVQKKYMPLAKGLTVFTVPIIAGQKYTLWGDSPTGALLAVGYSDKGRVLNETLQIINRLGCLRREQPCLIDTSVITVSSGNDGIVEYLTLFVQMPAATQGIFVAEGDYTEVGERQYGESVKPIMTIPNTTNWNIACLDRVVEGITGHTINVQQFENSIAWMQEKLSSEEWEDATGIRYQGVYKKGIWDKTFQQWVRNVFGKEMTVKGQTLPAIKNFVGEGVKEVEQRIKAVLGYAV